VMNLTRIQKGGEKTGQSLVCAIGTAATAR